MLHKQNIPLIDKLQLKPSVLLVGEDEDRQRDGYNGHGGTDWKIKTNVSIPGDKVCW